MPRPILITAGATRNPIDSMRSITANSSGKTGVYIASTLAQNGVSCRLLGSNLALLQPGAPKTSSEFTSTRDLLQQMNNWTVENPTGIIIHAAAVGDFEVAEQHTGKISSGSTLTLHLQPTPKIVDLIHDWSPDIHLVSFKAAAPQSKPDEVATIAHKQLVRTRSNLVFANVLGSIETNVLLMSPNTRTWHTNRMDGLHALIEQVLDWQ